MSFFKSIFLTMLCSFSFLYANDLQSCVQTEVSKTSVIFTCMHGEYYVTYTSSSKKDVENLTVLYTKADKYKYMKENQKENKE